MGTWIAGMRPWDTFGGLTYDPKRISTRRVLRPQLATVATARKGSSRFRWAEDRGAPLVHRETVERNYRDWVRECRNYLGRRGEYAAALERQHFTGQWHIHPLMDWGGIDQDERDYMGRLWYAKQGLSKLEFPRDFQDAATYASKYLSKDMESGDILLSPGLRKQLEGRHPHMAGFTRGRTE